MKKKFACLTLALCCALALVACDSKDKDQLPKDPSSDDKGTVGDTPSPPQGPTSDDPAAPPDDISNRVEDKEIVLSNGIRLGMKYSEVYEIIGIGGQAPNAAKPWVKKGGVSYIFGTFGNEICLEKIVLDGFAEDVTVFRGVKITDSAKTVLSKLPTDVTDVNKDRVLYGTDIEDKNGYAEIGAVSNWDRYKLNIYTADSKIEILYPQAAQNALMITVAKRVPGEALPEGVPSLPVEPAEIEHSENYKAFVSEEEIVMRNGVRLGMTLEEVCALLRYSEDIPDPETGKGGYILSDGVSYNFEPYADGFVLVSIDMSSSAAAEVSVLRDIKIGDSIESAISKLPAKNTKLQRWEKQVLYGEDKSNRQGYAELTYNTVYGNYTVNIYTLATVVSMTANIRTLKISSITIKERGDSPSMPSDTSLPRISSDEVVLSNGVRLGMSFKEVYNLLSYTGNAPSPENLSIVHQGDAYVFTPSEDDYVLQSVKIQKPYLTLFRGLRVEYHIDALFEKIPAADTGLKQWAIQDVYGNNEDDANGYACLKYSVSQKAHTLYFYTPEYTVSALIPDGVSYITEITMQLR